MQVRFYSSKKEQAYMKQYEKYVTQQQKYFDDCQELAEDLEIYTEFEEQDSRYVESLDFGKGLGLDETDSYTGRRSMPILTSNSNELMNWTKS